MVFAMAMTMLPTGVVRGATAELRPSADASLIQAAPARNNGGQAWVLAGITQNYTENRGLFLFDFTGLIPAGSVIDAVQLQFEVVRQPSDGFAPAPFGLHRMLRDWGEGNRVAVDNAGGLGAPAEPGDVTWLERRAFTGEAWAAPGGAPDVDFVAEASSREDIYRVGDSPYVFRSTETLVADVQLWVDRPQLNHGWMLMVEGSDANFTARQFASREDPDRAPVLRVTYTPVPEPGTLGLGMCALALVASAGMRRRIRERRASLSAGWTGVR